MDRREFIKKSTVGLTALVVGSQIRGALAGERAGLRCHPNPQFHHHRRHEADGHPHPAEQRHLLLLGL